MIINKVDDDNYIIKVLNDKLDNIDIFNIDEVEEFIKNIFKNFLKFFKLSGEVVLNIYLDLYYGIIIKIKREVILFDDEIDARVIFHLNNSFLYEVDYFYILNNTNIKNGNIYFYDNSFYLELTDFASLSDMYKISESSNVIWDNRVFNIINNGIKLSLAS